MVGNRPTVRGITPLEFRYAKSEEALQFSISISHRPYDVQIMLSLLVTRRMEGSNIMTQFGLLCTTKFYRVVLPTTSPSQQVLGLFLFYYRQVRSFMEGKIYRHWRLMVYNKV